MTKKEIIKSKAPWWEEVIDTPETEIVEENFYVDERLLKNKELIRVDMNIVQFPIFSKNTKRKVNQIVKYYFNKNRDTFITVTPQAGDYIPGETEEKIFIALMQLMKERGLPRKIVISAMDLKNKVKFSTTKYNSVIDKSLSRLASTNYVFKNTLYSNEKGGVIGEKIETSIFNIRTITLSKKENQKYREVYVDKRIKTVYEIEFSEHFYKNIIKKGYMVYNGEKLLEIDSSTARTIYMLIEKLRFDNLYLKLDTLFLIKRIPLKYSKKNIAQTVKTLEKSFQELLEKRLIEDFNIIKETTWEKSEIEIFFLGSANDEKQERFYQDKNDFRKLLSNLTISATEHDLVEEAVVVSDLDIDIEKKSHEKIEVTKDMINEILDILPSKARNLKTMPRTIKDSIEEYGFEKIKSVARYLRKNKVEKIRAYFIKALENNWVADEEIVVSQKTLKNPTIFTSEEKEAKSTYNEELYAQFKKFPIEIQNGIEVYAYREYIRQCGIETRIQQLAFKGSRKKYICEYLEKYPEIINGKEIENETPKVKEEKISKSKEKTKNIKEIEISKNEIITDIDVVKKTINNSIELANIVNQYTEEEKKLLIIDILKELMSYVSSNKLTQEKLDETINKYVKL